MENLKIVTIWDQIKYAVRLRYGSIINDDKLFSDGSINKIISKIQKVTGRSKIEIEQELEDWKAEYNY